MASSAAAPAPAPAPPRRSGSKKSKKAWRKSDVADIEEFLEEQRRDELTGGPAAAKQDADLFFVDTALPSAEARKSTGRRLPKPLRVDEILAPNKYVQARLVRPQRSSARKSRAEATIVLHKRQFLTAKDVTKEKVSRPSINPDAVYDIWANTDDGTRRPLLNALGYDNPMAPVKVKTPATVGKTPVPAAKAVPLPHPGQSYMPPDTAHQSLLEKLAEIENRRLSEVAQLDRKLGNASVRSNRTMSAHAAQLMESVMADVDVSADADADDADADADSDADAGVEAAAKTGASKASRAAGKVSAENRKSAQQRRREARAHKNELARQEERLEKRKLAEIDKTGSLLRKVTAEERKREEEARIRAQRTAERQATRVPRLGPHPYVPPVPDFKPADELPTSLRLATPEGNLFRDRQASLQARAMLEPRKQIAVRRRYKREEYLPKKYRDGPVA